MIICEIGRIPAISVPVVIRETNREIEEMFEQEEDILFDIDAWKSQVIRIISS